MKGTLSVAIVLAAHCVMYTPGANAGVVDNLFGGTKVVGTIELDVTVGDVVTSAKGRNARAMTSIGSLHEGTNAVGDTKITTSLGSVINHVRGSNSESCISIASRNAC